MPILDPNSIECFSKSPDQTCRLGMRLGSRLKTGDVLCFYGNLGAGKTTFIRGIGQGWGSPDPVTSPTFVLINEYSRFDGSLLFHMDAYRIGSAMEAEELDFERMEKRGVLVIEWAELIEEALPLERLEIRMDYVADEQRKLLFVAKGKRYITLMDEFRRQAFGDK